MRGLRTQGLFFLLKAPGKIKLCHSLLLLVPGTTITGNNLALSRQNSLLNDFVDRLSILTGKKYFTGGFFMKHTLTSDYKHTQGRYAPINRSHAKYSRTYFCSHRKCGKIHRMKRIFISPSLSYGYCGSLFGKAFYFNPCKKFQG